MGEAGDSGLAYCPAGAVILVKRFGRVTGVNGDNGDRK